LEGHAGEVAFLKGVRESAEGQLTSLPFDDEQLFRLLLDSADQGIYVTDNGRICVFCNAACVRLLARHDAGELLGTVIRCQVHPAEEGDGLCDERVCRLYEPLRTGTDTHFPEAVFPRMDGTFFPADCRSYPMRRDGVVVGCVVCFDDISESTRTSEALTRLSRAVEQTGDSVFITNRKGIIEYVNPAFEALTGYSRDEVIGDSPRLWSSGVHGQDVTDRLWETLLAGKTFKFVYTNRRKDGKLYFEDQTIAPIRDNRGEITHFVSTGRDITRRRRTQEALRRLNAQLEHEAARIAGVLHDEAGQLLTAAHIALAEVARDVTDPVRVRVHEVRRHLDRVEEQLRRLSHELRPQILDDLGLTEALRFLTDGVARRTGIQVRLDVSVDRRSPPLVETAIYRLVQEAMTNMTKHARASSVTIALRHEPHGLVCSIADDGVGFDVAEVVARRGEPGLGLAGIRDRIEAVDGTFDITSSPGSGTVLSVTIPHEK
jgi:PAS domain S-box-containing protein